MKLACISGSRPRKKGFKPEILSINSVAAPRIRIKRRAIRLFRQGHFRIGQRRELLLAPTL